MLALVVPARSGAAAAGCATPNRFNSPGALDPVILTCALGLLTLAAVGLRKRSIDLGTAIMAYALGSEIGHWLLVALDALVPHLVPHGATDDAPRRMAAMTAFIFIALAVSHLCERSAKQAHHPP